MEKKGGMTKRRTKKKAVIKASKKRAIIKEYERTYGVNLTEEELNSLIEKSFSNPDISSDTKKKVKKKMERKKVKPKKAKE
jgi:uncharacterized protein YpuA (DUF1002 family)